MFVFNIFGKFNVLSLVIVMVFLLDELEVLELGGIFFVDIVDVIELVGNIGDFIWFFLWIVNFGFNLIIDCVDVEGELCLVDFKVLFLLIEECFVVIEGWVDKFVLSKVIVDCICFLNFDEFIDNDVVFKLLIKCLVEIMLV